MVSLWWRGGIVVIFAPVCTDTEPARYHSTYGPTCITNDVWCQIARAVGLPTRSGDTGQGSTARPAVASCRQDAGRLLRRHALICYLLDVNMRCSTEMAPDVPRPPRHAAGTSEQLLVWNVTWHTLRMAGNVVDMGVDCGRLPRTVCCDPFESRTKDHRTKDH